MSSQAIGMVLLAVVSTGWMRRYQSVEYTRSIVPAGNGATAQMSAMRATIAVSMNPAGHAVVSPRGSRLVIRRMARW